MTTFELLDFNRQATLLRDYASQIESISKRADGLGLKAVELGAGGKAFARAVKDLNAHISAINKSIASRIEND